MTATENNHIENNQASDDAVVFVHVDKTIVKITGLSIKGLNIQQLETLLSNKLETMLRIIGVTGKSIEMDVYGLDESQLLRNEQGIIEIISLARGIQVSDVTRMSTVQKIIHMPFEEIPPYREGMCMRERWMRHD